MKLWAIILLTIFLIACNNSKTKEYPPLERYVHTDNRTCNSGEAEKFSTLDSMLSDFYTNSQYKDSFELNLRLGAFYYYKKNYDSSLIYNFKAKDINPSEPKVHFNIALDYCELNKWNDALNSINKAIEICGDKWEYLNSKCYILGKLDSCEEAINVGLISYKMNPENTKIYGNLLSCFDKLGQRDSVRKFLDIAIDKFDFSSEVSDNMKRKYHYE
ncbi:MAG: hypothetical protein A2W93_11875 [Bacteroidetes bacterium GWF2_43_63]|nr:MAG: hypothetical protein A2W94_00410 [Bacteroidetes bacterium GWE2_42_42]OFY55442.1 MAG: hypothetical protein A2W93_11875 [Bacteroidetes bacterium GWF2_43_63]HBG70297.1 hypothetical protein [Bacteroidales bacterium]HCB60318.1 hypothetical protein [Bacteroidales bacterium]HCY23570.1 hypothetical protein [Bacteroidales bacterium]